MRIFLDEIRMKVFYFQIRNFNVLKLILIPPKCIQNSISHYSQIILKLQLSQNFVSEFEMSFCTNLGFNRSSPSGAKAG
jgi:hypothetical protein